ncbi:hypothetical protein [Cyanobium sp. N5-Cardenillas]|uniref:hypothetical protein n=1 Tax=Cyanobium sp. N5-Cardenillas TaxID=2823720 RepID=UPI0020CC3656|nr:hypothetical protein [Cyanobium sp. N5-Cardenillas]MCP9785822.1 hypothetical protein [Cyanobium sp. N5-Cardenillas]
MLETVPVRKACNALIAEAQPDFALYSAAAKAAGIDPQEEVLSAVLKGFRTFYGGLWVGGTAELTATHVAFKPNVVNQLLHKSDYSWSVPLAEVGDVSYEVGMLTGIICLATPRGIAKLRCFGAKSFLSRIAKQWDADRIATQPST